MSLAIDRRAFLRLAALGLSSAVIAEKMGLAEKVRSYFFAPRGGWLSPESWGHVFYGKNPEWFSAGTLTPKMIHDYIELLKQRSEDREPHWWVHPRELQQYRELFTEK